MPHQRIAAATLAITVTLAGTLAAAQAASATSIPPPDTPIVTWINYYRTQAGLLPVRTDATLDAGARNHSCWMLANGAAHHETPGSYLYTDNGNHAGAHGNVAVHSSANLPNGTFTELWMTAPFHAIGFLRPGLRTIGTGRCDTDTPYPGQRWRSAATVDITTGLDWDAAHTRPILFPAAGTTTHLTRFVTETPDPRPYCGWYNEPVGLPLIATLTEPVDATGATLTGPAGPVETCVLTAANTDGDAQAILADRTALIIPRQALVNGTWRAELRANGRATAWAFTVDTDGADDPRTSVDGPPLALTPHAPQRVVDTRHQIGATRLTARRETRINLGAHLRPGAAAAAANITVTRPAGDGYLTAYPCGRSGTTSTLNFRAGATAANGAIVNVDTDGALCVTATADTDLIIDINGSLSGDGIYRLSPITPRRVLDTRDGTGGYRRVRRGDTVNVDIGNSAAAAAVNIATVNAADNGYVTAYPCNTTRPTVSNVNPSAATTRSNNTIVATDNGRLCLYSNVDTDLIVDVTATFAADGLRYQPLAPTRIVDTRQAHWALSAGQVGVKLAARNPLTVTFAGAYGIPADAQALNVNVTVDAADNAGWLAAQPARATGGTSTVNYPAASSTANGAQLPLNTGAATILTSQPAHVIIDINGAWTP